MAEFALKHKRWLIPLLTVAALAPLTPFLDRAVAQYFFSAGGRHFVSSPILDFIYVFALVPGQITAGLACIALIFSYCFISCHAWRPHALYLVLTLAIGSGFITHALLKDHWGRPRPVQVIEFGGKQEFRPFYKPNFFNQPEPSKSFPCGHCTMGFYFFALMLMGIRLKKKLLLYSGWILAVLLGTALSFARMAQGGHFLSDVLISGLIMWLTALALDWMIYEEYA